jgi:hypothetical protein
MSADYRVVRASSYRHVRTAWTLTGIPAKGMTIILLATGGQPVSPVRHTILARRRCVHVVSRRGHNPDGVAAQPEGAKLPGRLRHHSNSDRRSCGQQLSH